MGAEQSFGGDFRQLSGTRTGLNLVYFGIITIIVAVILMIFAIIVGMGLGGGRNGAGLAFLGIGTIGAVVVILVGSIMMFVGQCFCLTVPERSGAKGLVMTSVVLQVCSFIIGFGAGLAGGMNPGMGPGGQNPMMQGGQFLNGILGLIAFFCFLNFIKKVVIFIGDREQQHYAQKVITQFAAIIGLYIAFTVIMVVVAIGAAGGGGREGLAVVGLVGTCFGLGIFIWAIVAFCMYTTLLRNTVAAIDRKMRTG
jgi:hypothetical protein